MSAKERIATRGGKALIFFEEFSNLILSIIYDLLKWR